MVVRMTDGTTIQTKPGSAITLGQYRYKRDGSYVQFTDVEGTLHHCDVETIKSIDVG